MIQVCGFTSLFHVHILFSQAFSQLAHIKTLDEQIKTEIQEIDKQSIVLKEGIAKCSDHTKMQNSANAMRDCLHDMTEKYSRAIQLMEILGNASQLNMDKVDCRSEWKELYDLVSKMNLLERDLLTQYKQVQLSESMTSYGDLKADCLRLVDSINHCIMKKHPSTVILSNSIQD